jgi:hypothetical protein
VATQGSKRRCVLGIGLTLWQLAFVADFETLNFHLITKINMGNNTSTNHENGNDANRLLADVKITELKAGMSFSAVVPFSQPKTIKVHIDHILPSISKGRKLIVYRVFGKHKQWWHEFMCTDEDMQWYKERAERK